MVSPKGLRKKAKLPQVLSVAVLAGVGASAWAQTINFASEDQPRAPKGLTAGDQQRLPTTNAKVMIQPLTKAKTAEKIGKRDKKNDPNFSLKKSMVGNRVSLEKISQVERANAKRQSFSAIYLQNRSRLMRTPQSDQWQIAQASPADSSAPSLTTTAQPAQTVATVALPDIDNLLSDPKAFDPITINALRISGNRVIDSKTLEGAAREFLMRPIDRQSDLSKLRDSLTLVYVNAGYVNSGAVFENPEAIAKAGDVLEVLDVKIIEGRVTGTEIKGLDGLSESYVKERLLADEDEVLNLVTLQERFQLLLQDPLFKKVQSRIKPAQERGGAILDVEVERASVWSGFVGINNQRSASSGENQISSGFTFRNLTTLGDTINLSANMPLKNSGKSQAYSASFSVPIPYIKTLVTMGYDKGQTLVTEPPFDRLNFSNDNQNLYFSVNQPIINSLNHLLSVDVNHYDRKSANYVNNQPYSFALGEVSGKTNNQGLRLSINYTWRQPDFVLSSRLTHTTGKHDYYRDPRLPSNIIIPQNNYKHNLLQALFNYRLTEGGTILSLRGNYQTTSDMLIGMERFAITGANTVRGYLESSSIFDRARTYTAEVQIPIYNAEGWNVKIAPFMDWGEGENVVKQNDTDKKTKVSSYGISLTGQYKDISMRLDYAQPRENKQLVTGSSLQSKGVGFSMRWDF